jgi:hypothetical protein
MWYTSPPISESVVIAKPISIQAASNFLFRVKVFDGLSIIPQLFLT